MKYITVELNNDPAGGGGPFGYVKPFPDFWKAQKWVKDNTGPWRRFEIYSKVV